MSDVLATHKKTEIKQYDVLQATIAGHAYAHTWEDYFVIKELSEATTAIGMVQNPGVNRFYRIVRKGLDARVVLSKTKDAR